MLRLLRRSSYARGTCGDLPTVAFCRSFSWGPTTPGGAATPGADASSVAVPPLDSLLASKSSTGPGIPSPYMDALDAVWNAKWLGRTEGTLDSGDPLLAGLFSSIQSALGVEPWFVLMLLGSLTRLFTLYFSFYGERAGARMRQALPELKEQHNSFQRVYYSERSSALDIQVAATILKAERKRVFDKHGTSTLKCLASLAGSPLVVFGLLTASSLCESPFLSIGSSSFMWCPALSLTDPLGILPIVCCALTLLNFELSISKELKTGWMKNVVWGARLGCLCVIPAAMSFRSGVALYWIGMSTAGLLYPLLLRLKAFRLWFGIPEASPNPPTQRPTEQSADPLHTQLLVQFPYLSRLLNPESEENTHMMARSAPTVARGGRHTQSQPSATYAAFIEERDRASRCVGSPLLRKSGKGREFPGAVTEDPCVTEQAKDGGACVGASYASRTLSSRVSAGAWRANNVGFREDDFIPTYSEPGSGASDGTTKR